MHSEKSALSLRLKGLFQVFSGSTEFAEDCEAAVERAFPENLIPS